MKVIYFQQNGPIPTVLQKINVDIYSDTICGLRFRREQHICFGASLGGVCNVSMSFQVNTTFVRLDCFAWE